MVKKLRYYARFVVVSLLLEKCQIVDELLNQLSVLVKDYNMAFKPSDYAEWSVVLSELETFLQVQKKLGSACWEKSIRLNDNLLKSDKLSSSIASPIRLQEAILVGNCQNQVDRKINLGKVFRTDFGYVPNAPSFRTRVQI